MLFDPYSILRFYYNIPDLNYWLIIIGSSIALLFLTTVIFSFLLFKKSGFQKRYQINMAFKSAAIFSLLSITALSVWFTFYENLIYVEKLQLPILSAITIILIIYMTIGFTNSSKVSKNDLRYLGIHQGPLTERAEKARLRKHLNKFKLIYFVIFIPFLLLLLKFEKKYFYSIVYDASASMLSSLDNTRYYLNQNINNLDVDADFMISTIPGESNTKTVKRRYKLFGEIEDWPYVKKGSIKAFMKDSLSKIVNVKSSSKLFSNDVPMESISDFINYIDDVELGSEKAGSPISELIWSNFIESIGYTKNTFYNKKKLIVITDGIDNLSMNKDWECVLNFSLPVKSNGKEEDVFPSDFYDEITFLDVALLDVPLSMINQCEDIVNVEDGSDEDSFAYVFDGQLNDIYVDKDFLYYLSIFLVLGGLISSLFSVKN